MATTLRAADSVYYGMDSLGKKRQRWRVTHFFKRIEETFGSKPAESEVDKIIEGVVERHLLREKLQRAELGLRHARRFRYQYCTPEEATHVELVAICGAIAPVGECEYVGPVGWSPEDVEEAQRDAVSPLILGRLTDWQWE